MDEAFQVMYPKYLDVDFGHQLGVEGGEAVILGPVPKFGALQLQLNHVDANDLSNFEPYPCEPETGCDDGLIPNGNICG